MGDIMYKNLLYIKGELKLIVINGCNGQIDAYHEYSFGTLWNMVQSVITIDSLWIL